MTTPSERVASSGSASSERVEEAKARAGAVTDQAKERATDVAREARRQAQGFIDTQRHTIAEKFLAIARALESTADRLDEEDEITLAEYTDRAADQLQRLSRRIEDSDTNRLMGELNGYARRNPLGFLAGAVAVGVLASRVLKASVSSTTSDDLDEDLGEDDEEWIRDEVVTAVPEANRETIVYGASGDPLRPSGARMPAPPSMARPAESVPSATYNFERSDEHGNRKLP